MYSTLSDPVSRGQTPIRKRGEGNIYFPCSGDHEQDWQLYYPFYPYSAMCNERTYAHLSLLLLLLMIHTISALSLQLKKLRCHNKSAIDLSNANPACGHKEVRRSTGHIMVTTRYSDQQGSKSRQKVMRLYKQWHRPISKRFIKPPYSISRATSIDSECCRLPTTSVLSKKPEKIRSNRF